jgi:hypothetical protein
MWISKKKFEKLSSNLSAKLNVELYMKINELQQIIRRKEQHNNNLNKYCMELRSLDSLNNKKIEQFTEENTRLGRTNIGLVMQCKDAYKRIQELEGETKIHIIYSCEPLPEKKKEEEVDVKPTYFTLNETRTCVDLCEIRNNITMIGSFACQKCIACVESNLNN